jgi:hypothetical protein
MGLEACLPLVMKSFRPRLGGPWKRAMGEPRGRLGSLPLRDMKTPNVVLAAQ